MVAIMTVATASGIERATIELRSAWTLRLRSAWTLRLRSEQARETPVPTRSEQFISCAQLLYSTLALNQETSKVFKSRRGGAELVKFRTRLIDQSVGFVEGFFDSEKRGIGSFLRCCIFACGFS
jgi:hypothetical protein